jgi:hypothetical protein
MVSKSKSKGKSSKKRSNTNNQMIAQPRTMGRPSNSKVPKSTFKVNNSAVTDVCSMLDPICIHSVNSKAFSSSNVQTACYRIEQFVPLYTASNGLATMQVAPYTSEMYRTASAYTGSVPSAWGAWQVASTQVALVASFAEYKVVSMGVRVFPMCNATESKGVTTFGVTSNLNSAPAYYDVFIETHRKAISDGDVSWISIPTDEVNFIPMSAVNTDDNSPWTYLNIMISSATPSISCLGVEVTFNIECVPLGNSILTGMVSPSRPESSLIMSALNNARQFGQHIIDGTPSEVSGYLKSLGRSALGYAGGPVAAGAWDLATLGYNNRNTLRLTG